VFCASVLGYRYICSKFITAPMIHDRGSDMIGEVLYILYPYFVALVLVVKCFAFSLSTSLLYHYLIFILDAFT